jgi:hypothetical protein
VKILVEMCVRYEERPLVLLPCAEALSNVAVEADGRSELLTHSAVLKLGRLCVANRVGIAQLPRYGARLLATVVSYDECLGKLLQIKQVEQPQAPELDMALLSVLLGIARNSQDAHALSAVASALVSLSLSAEHRAALDSGGGLEIACGLLPLARIWGDDIGDDSNATTGSEPPPAMVQAASSALAAAAKAAQVLRNVSQHRSLATALLALSPAGADRHATNSSLGASLGVVLEFVALRFNCVPFERAAIADVSGTNPLGFHTGWSPATGWRQHQQRLLLQAAAATAATLANLAHHDGGVCTPRLLDAAGRGGAGARRLVSILRLATISDSDHGVDSDDEDGDGNEDAGSDAVTATVARVLGTPPPKLQKDPANAKEAKAPTKGDDGEEGDNATQQLVVELLRNTSGAVANVMRCPAARGVLLAAGVALPLVSLCRHAGSQTRTSMQKRTVDPTVLTNATAALAHLSSGAGAAVLGELRAAGLTEVLLVLTKTYSSFHDAAVVGDNVLEQTRESHLQRIMLDWGLDSESSMPETLADRSTAPETNTIIDSGDRQALVQLLANTTAVLRNLSADATERTLLLSLGAPVVLAALCAADNYPATTHGQVASAIQHTLRCNAAWALCWLCIYVPLRLYGDAGDIEGLVATAAPAMIAVLSEHSPSANPTGDSPSQLLTSAAAALRHMQQALSSRAEQPTQPLLLRGAVPAMITVCTTAALAVARTTAHPTQVENTAVSTAGQEVTAANSCDWFALVDVLHVLGVLAASTDDAKTEILANAGVAALAPLTLLCPPGTSATPPTPRAGSAATSLRDGTRFLHSAVGAGAAARYVLLQLGMDATDILRSARENQGKLEKQVSEQHTSCSSVVDSTDPENEEPDGGVKSSAVAKSADQSLIQLGQSLFSAMGDGKAAHHGGGISSLPPLLALISTSREPSPMRYALQTLLHLTRAARVWEAVASATVPTAAAAPVLTACNVTVNATDASLIFSSAVTPSRLTQQQSAFWHDLVGAGAPGAVVGLAGRLLGTLHKLTTSKTAARRKDRKLLREQARQVQGLLQLAMEVLQETGLALNQQHQQHQQQQQQHQRVSTGITASTATADIVSFTEQGAAGVAAAVCLSLAPSQAAPEPTSNVEAAPEKEPRPEPVSARVPPLPLALPLSVLLPASGVLLCICRCEAASRALAATPVPALCALVGTQLLSQVDQDTKIPARAPTGVFTSVPLSEDAAAVAIASLPRPFFVTFRRKTEVAARERAREYALSLVQGAADFSPAPQLVKDDCFGAMASNTIVEANSSDVLARFDGGSGEDGEPASPLGLGFKRRPVGKYSQGHSVFEFVVTKVSGQAAVRGVLVGDILVAVHRGGARSNPQVLQSFCAPLCTTDLATLCCPGV